ncbi:hypothetical protein BDQ17DRAFT_954987 [Cyathus striatus]|nr:hypothetical protein BDQ17DRAFT_954987 [Cyathus striatus]
MYSHFSNEIIALLLDNPHISCFLKTLQLAPFKQSFTILFSRKKTKLRYINIHHKTCVTIKPKRHSCHHHLHPGVKKPRCCCIHHHKTNRNRKNTINHDKIQPSPV